MAKKQTTDRVYYTIQCHNEWCNGPKTHAMQDERPGPTHCPVCGWLALDGSGIQRRVIPAEHRGRMMVTVGNRIKYRRGELGWTQAVLAQQAGISKGFLCDLENDKRGVGANKLLDIARTLGRSIDFLMTGDE